MEAVTTGKSIDIFDSTLRDGMQAAGIAFSVDDKLKIARTLDAMGIAFIEAGNPGSNPKDLEFFRQIASQPLKHARLCAFGSTRRKNLSAAEDAALASSRKQAHQPSASLENPGICMLKKSSALRWRKIFV